MASGYLAKHDFRVETGTVDFLKVPISVSIVGHYGEQLSTETLGEWRSFG